MPTAREGRTAAGLNSVIALGGTTWRTFERWANTRTRERGAEYEAFKQSLGEALVDLACAEVPELKGRIESMEVSTRQVASQFRLKPPIDPAWARVCPC